MNHGSSLLFGNQRFAKLTHCFVLWNKTDMFPYSWWSDTRVGNFTLPRKNCPGNLVVFLFPISYFFAIFFLGNRKFYSSFFNGFYWYLSHLFNVKKRFSTEMKKKYFEVFAQIMFRIKLYRQSIISLKTFQFENYFMNSLYNPLICRSNHYILKNRFVDELIFCSMFLMHFFLKPFFFETIVTCFELLFKEQSRFR